jgi:hypothetical protein
MLESIYKLLEYIEANWTLIAAIITMSIAIYKKAKDYLNKSFDEQLNIAKAQICETMLKWVTEAEKDYRQWTAAGAIKRSQVIDQIFREYPILSRVTNQDDVIQFLDDTIDESLKTMRKIFEENSKQDTEDVTA